MLWSSFALVAAKADAMACVHVVAALLVPGPKIPSRPAEISWKLSAF